MAEREDQQQQAPTEAPAEQVEDGFGAAFAERAKEVSGTQTDGNEPSDKAPAEAGAEQAPAEEAATNATEGGAEKPDPLAELTPEQLRQRYQELEAERDRLRTSERSQRGRVGALTRKLNTLTIGTPAPTAAPKQKEGEEAPASTEGDLDPELQKAIDEYPDVVGPVVANQKKLEATLAEVRGRIDQIDKVATTRDEVEADAAELSIALISLEVLHPDYAEYNPQNESFTAWLGDQPQKVVELANSYDPREVSLALTLYKTERSAALAKSSEGGEPGKQDTSATDEKRARQMEGNRQVPNRGAPVAAGVPNEFSAAWKARANAKA